MENTVEESIWKQRFYELLDLSAKKISCLQNDLSNIRNEHHSIGIKLESKKDNFDDTKKA